MLVNIDQSESMVDGGIRFGFGSKGMAYNMHGDMGIQFEFENGKKLLVGSQKTAEFEAIIYNELKLQNEK